MKLLTTKAYLLLIDEDAEINEGDHFFANSTGEVLYASHDMMSWNMDIPKNHRGWRKIIAYCPLKLDAGVLDLPLLPPHSLGHIPTGFIPDEKYCIINGNMHGIYTYEQEQESDK